MSDYIESLGLFFALAITISNRYNSSKLEVNLETDTCHSNIGSVNKYSILLNSVLFSSHEYYRRSHTQSTNTVRIT